MAARPTNSWFANLFYGTGREMVAPLPYHCKVTASGIDVCVPNLDTAAFSTAIIAVWAANLSLGSTAAASATQKVTGFTDLGCTVTWSSGMTCDLVRGAAYVTMRYTALTPVISTVHAINQINGIGAGPGSTATGTKFQIFLNNQQNWVLYFSSSVTLTMSGTQTLTVSGPFTGTVRAAYSNSQATEDALDASAACIPTGGTATMSLAGGTYTKTLTYATTGTGALLTYAMPHHQDTLVSPTYAAATVGSLRGSLRGVLGSMWTLSMPAAVVGEANKNPIDSTKLSAVTTALAADKTFVPTIGDPYFGGKSLAKSARLISIANQLGDTAARDTLLAALKPKMADYFALLRYETNKGGIVSLVGLTNGDADFGNGYYNDHYFHYGYTIYAASVIARYDSAWAAANLDKVNALVRDICNPSSDDTYFTPFRHWDHFEGHSWASGYPAATDGRNQESTSEAVNAWWGVQQWGTITNQPNVAQLGTMLMTEEILTARKYWQVKQSGSVYPTSAFKSNGCVGILWSNKVDHGTWFSSAKECIFGIQMLPTNPTTEALIDPAWISEVWTNNLTSIYAGAQEPWKGPLVGALAQVNAADAWTKVNALTAWDDGTSKTQMLYHVATQSAAPFVTPSGIFRDLSYDTSADQALTHDVSGRQISQPHQFQWSTFTRRGTGHSARFEVHNNPGDVVNGQAYRAMDDVFDTNDGGDTVGSVVGYPDVYWATSVYWPTTTGTPTQATVSSGFGQTTTPDYEMMFEIHERPNVNGSTAGINNLGQVSNLSLMIRNGQFQFRGCCGTWTWNGTSWTQPSWSTTTPGTTGKNDQIPIPIVKASGTSATMLMDAWLDVIFHVRFAKDSTGLVEIWARQAGQNFTTSPNLTINGPTHKVAVGSDGVTRSSADYDAANQVTGCYAHLGVYTGSTSWEDVNNGAHIVIHDETRRFGTLAEAKANWG